MSTSNEVAAMRLALEALEHGLDYAKGEQFENAQRFKGYEHLAPDDTHSIQLIETAIKALEKALSEREALAKQKHGEPNYKALWKQMCERCDELDAKLAKQEHDPYDEVFIAYGLPKQEHSVSVGEPVGQVSNYDTRTGFLYKDLEHGALLYTTPYFPTGRQQRPSLRDIKPLTDEQKFELARERFSGDWNQRIAIALIEDTEAAHDITEENK